MFRAAVSQLIYQRNVLKRDRFSMYVFTLNWVEKNILTILGLLFRRKNYIEG